MKIKQQKKEEHFNKKIFSNLKIPYEIKYDLIYCQVFLRHYIKVHQLWTMHIKNSPDDGFAKQCLKELEQDIRDLGEEQKMLSEKLREFVNGHYKKLDDGKRRFDLIKEYGDAVVTKELYNTYVYVTLTKLNKSTLFEPINVQPRKTASELLSKFKIKTITPVVESKRKSKLNPIPDGIVPLDTAASTPTEPRSAASTPPALPNPVHVVKTYENVKQISLLKPISERLSSSNTSSVEENTKLVAEPKKPESPPKPVVETALIKSSRLNLFNALKKAKNRLATTTNPPPVIKTPPSSTNSSPISSGVSSPIPIVRSPEPQTDSQNNDVIECEEVYEEELDQEQFLRLFGLYTLEKSIQITSKRRERRRRNVQSTEKLDYHYGRFDFYEPKPQPLRRKKPILYSPPATRALKKRKGSDDSDAAIRAAKMCPSSSTSNSNEIEKVGCNTCYVRNGEKLNTCEKCSQFFHLKCHKNVFSAQSLRSRENMCPNCFRQQQKLATAMNSHIRDLKLRDRLILKNEQLNYEKEKLAIKLEIVENKYVLNLTEKENLHDDEHYVKNKMKNLLNTIGLFKN